jgi:hypothetical protein
MSTEERTTTLPVSTTRRTVVKTGVKLAYASPLVAVSTKLGTHGAAAAISGGSCSAGYELVHGGCFKIARFLDDRTTCGAACRYSPGSVDGSGNYLCANVDFSARCNSNADCPTGQACQVAVHVCISPC